MKVGDGVTYNLGTDEYAMTVRKVSPSGHMVWVSQDRVRARNDTVLFIPQDVPESMWEKFTLREDKKYRRVGWNFGTLSLGRASYRDPSI